MNLTIKPSGQLRHKLSRVAGLRYFPRREFAHVADFRLERRVHAGDIISHRLGLDDAPHAFQILVDRSAEEIIVVP